MHSNTCINEFEVAINSKPPLLARSKVSTGFTEASLKPKDMKTTQKHSSSRFRKMMTEHIVSNQC